ncbi:MAG: hypothetical protein WCE21_03140 [Candidatus Babeliales bacterium]
MKHTIYKQLFLFVVLALPNYIYTADSSSEEENPKTLVRFFSDPKIKTQLKRTGSLKKINIDVPVKTDKQPKQTLFSKMSANMGAMFHSQDILSLPNKKVTKAHSAEQSYGSYEVTLKHKKIYKSKTDGNYEESWSEIEVAEKALFDSLAEYDIAKFVMNLSELEQLYSQYDIAKHAINAQNKKGDTPAHIILRDMKGIDTRNQYEQIGLISLLRLITAQYENENMNKKLKNIDGKTACDYIAVLNHDEWFFSQKVFFGKKINALSRAINA